MVKNQRKGLERERFGSLPSVSRLRDYSGFCCGSRGWPAKGTNFVLIRAKFWPRPSWRGQNLLKNEGIKCLLLALL